MMKSMMNRMLVSSLAVLLVAACPSESSAATYVENFDDLTAGIDLAGQGGWTGSDNPDVETAASFLPGNPLYGMSGNILHNNEPDGQTRASLGFSFNSTHEIVMSFDTYIGSDGVRTFAFFGVEDGDNISTV